MGGSDVPALLGIAPASWSRRTPFALFLDKMGKKQGEQDLPESKVLRRGKKLEPYILEMLEEEYGLKPFFRNKQYADPEHGFLAAEIDFEFKVTEQLAERFGLEKGLINSLQNGEIKTVHPFIADEWGDPDTDQVPVHYVAQVMHGMMITGAQVCLVAALFGADVLKVYKIARDDGLIKLMREKEVTFWKENVMKQVPPEPANDGDLQRMFYRDKGTAIAADGNQEVMGELGKLFGLQVKLDELEREIKDSAFKVKHFMGENAVVTLNGVEMATWKSQKSKRFDQLAFGKQHPILLKEFSKETETRVFRLKGPKGEKA